MKTIHFFFFRRFFRKDSIANNDYNYLSRFMASQIFRNVQVFSHRERKISFATHLSTIVYIADTSVQFLDNVI